MTLAEKSSIQDKTITVSVIVMNYNYEKFLKDAIDSCLSQTYPNVEVVVVDDGSTDNSKDIIKSFNDQIIPIFKKNGGQASALNAGFNACSGDIICLLDADDLFVPERLENVVNLFQSDPTVDWVFTESAAFETEQLSSEKLPALYDQMCREQTSAELNRIDFRKHLETGKIPGFTPSTSNLCFSRKILEKIFPLPEIKGLSGMAITDLYMKSIAVGLGTGYKTTKQLGVYRLHNNYYKSLDVDKKRRMFGEIYTTTGYWMKKKFSSLEKISSKFLAKGFATYLSSNYKKELDSDANCRKMFQEYLSDINFFKKISVYLFTFLYWSKLRFKDFV